MPYGSGKLSKTCIIHIIITWISSKWKLLVPLLHSMGHANNQVCDDCVYEQCEFVYIYVGVQVTCVCVLTAK